MSQTCFLIDDDKDDQEFFEFAVSELAPRVNFMVFSHLSEAIESMNQTGIKPDYIFLGHNLPLLKGIEGLKILKASNGFSDIPVIVHSDLNDNAIARECKTLGAMEYKLKTPSLDVFRKYLSEIFGMSLTTPAA